ncbi:MAG TPA: amidohydrolase family protein [Tepidisphaeraceae bacterium]|nr:amidohydrolase family protein [Tepidisphaeraceae bacterium]
MNRINRRTFIGGASTLAAATLLGCSHSKDRQVKIDEGRQQIVDAHVHVWNLQQFRLLWLDHAGPLLDRNYTIADYEQAIEGLDIVRSYYVEVDVAPDQKEAEARYVTQLCAQGSGPIRAAILGGTPGRAGFRTYIEQFKNDQHVRGVRCSFGDAIKHRQALTDDLHFLADLGMSFDLLLGSPMLNDAAEVVRACPNTRFILDHCGGASPDWIAGPRADRSSFQSWKDAISQLAANSNVCCKISGVAESGQGPPDIESIAQIVNHCFDSFGGDRVLFASNWPVCLKAVTIQQWLGMVKQLAKARSNSFQDGFFSWNSHCWYRRSSSPR